MNHEIVHYPAFSCMGLEGAGVLAAPHSWVPDLWRLFWARHLELGIRGPVEVWGLMRDEQVPLAPWGGERGLYLASINVPLGTPPWDDWKVWTVPATTWLRISCRMDQIPETIAFAKQMLQNHIEWRWGSAVHERYPVGFRDPATDELDLLMGLLPR